MTRGLVWLTNKHRCDRHLHLDTHHIKTRAHNSYMYQRGNFPQIEESLKTQFVKKRLNPLKPVWEIKKG